MAKTDEKPKGRPKKPDAERRESVLRVLLTEAEKAEIDAAAALERMDVSTWVRREILILAGQKRPRRRN